MEQKLLSITEVSEYLGLSKNTIYSWIWQRKIPYVKCGRLVKFDKKDIDQWIERHKIDILKYEKD
ncbi:MAG: helix-turn-helix domain-containing protein [Elusimicrobiota bacterium]